MAKMTNSEKYLRDGVDVKQMATEMVDYFNFPPYEGIGEGSIEEFFGKEAEQLTEDEKVILRNIDKKRYQKIERDWGTLWIHGVCKDGFSHAEEFTCYEHLFQFIKKGEEYSIQELLGDEE